MLRNRGLANGFGKKIFTCIILSLLLVSILYFVVVHRDKIIKIIFPVLLGLSLHTYFGP